MPMRTAALALLTDLDCWVSPEQVAKSFNHDPSIVQRWFDDLVGMGYVNQSDGMYKASEHGKAQVFEVIQAEAAAD